MRSYTFYVCSAGILDQVGTFNSKHNIMDRTLNISWTAPTAVTILPATRPEIFYCVEINSGTATESIGCNRAGDMNEETSVIISDIVCGANYEVIIIPFNRVGDGVNSTVTFPAGMLGNGPHGLNILVYFIQCS